MLGLVAVVGVATVGRAGPVTATPTGTSAASTEPAIAAGIQPVPPRQRETGTDGLMGRLPFDLPSDPDGPTRNRFTIDDVVAGRSDDDRRPPWVRRIVHFAG